MKELQEKLIRAIDEDVRSNADLVEEMLNHEKDLLLNDQINFFREGLEKDKAAYLEGELKEIRTYAATRSSRDRLDVKKKLIELRAHYTGELFNLVRKQVLDFSKSDTYLTYIQQGLGGFRYVDEENRMEFSCSLDEKCEEQMEWFASHSSFRIMEREDCHE